MGSKWNFILLSVLAIFSSSVESARILAVVPSPTHSHHIWNRSLMLALAKRGHHITVLSPDIEKEKVPNYRHILLEDSYTTNEEKFDFEEMAEGPLLSVTLVMDWGIECCKHQMQTKGAKELLRMPPDSFDLIIMETVFNDCTFLYLHHFGGGTRIPIVGITAYGIGPWTDLLTGARTMPSVFAFPSLPFLSKMSFWERLVNTATTGVYWAGMYFYYHPLQQKIAEAAYGKPLPPLWKLASNISLLLVNNHYVLNGPQALLPGIIDVSGMQCSPSKPLPKDIHDFIDGSPKGAIYFSLGSNIKSEILRKEKLKIIINTFAALGPEIRVLWKFDPSTSIEDLPANVLLKKWLPQEDVLGHPKLLAFVSHGGLLSTQESIYHRVPIVGLPFFVDQHTNVRRLVEMGIGKQVDYKTLNKETFTTTILEVINNP
ncbi:UDP-glycosyltransferase, partial [Ladona fulva]